MKAPTGFSASGVQRLPLFRLPPEIALTNNGHPKACSSVALYLSYTLNILSPVPSQLTRLRALHSISNHGLSSASPTWCTRLRRYCWEPLSGVLGACFLTDCFRRIPNESLVSVRSSPPTWWGYVHSRRRGAFNRSVKKLVRAASVSCSKVCTALLQGVVLVCWRWTTALTILAVYRRDQPPQWSHHCHQVCA